MKVKTKLEPQPKMKTKRIKKVKQELEKPNPRKGEVKEQEQKGTAKHDQKEMKAKNLYLAKKRTRKWKKRTRKVRKRAKTSQRKLQDRRGRTVKAIALPKQKAGSEEPHRSYRANTGNSYLLESRSTEGFETGQNRREEEANLTTEVP